MKKSIFLAALLTAAALPAAFAGSFLAEFEDFKTEPPAQAKGWGIANHNNYVQFFGKGAKISAVYELPETGDYYVWVRAWAHNDVFRKASLSVNGIKVGDFGDGKPEGDAPGWTWTRSKRKLHLESGKIDVKAVGKSEYARFDAMILTTTEDQYTGKVEDLPALKLHEDGMLSAAGHKIKAAGTIGAGEPILVFSGLRPWMGRDFGNIFSKSGAKVLLVNGPFLDGLSGAPIKQHMVDKIEPEPFDGITPAFETLEKQKLVIFHLFRTDLLEKLLTPERVAALKKYVENGGHILFTRSAPSRCAELLPVELGEDDTIDEVYTANRPAGKAFEIFSETLPVYGVYREAALRPGAEALSMIRDPQGREIAPYVARIQIGKGSVTFFNAERSNPKQMKEYGNWAYGAGFFAALANDCANLSLDPGKVIRRPAEIPAREEVNEVAVSVLPPAFAITPTTGNIAVSGDTATFADGAKLVVQKDGKVDFYLAGSENPLVRNAQIPAIKTLGAARSFTSETAEAVDVKEDARTVKLDWAYQGMSVRKDEAVLRYTAQDAEMLWIFQSGKFDLDGRIFNGYADHVEIVTCPALVGNVSFVAEVTPDKPLLARRFACYASPRGYTEVDMTGKTAGDTQNWSVFGSGQPFEYLVFENGLYLAHVSDPVSTSHRLMRGKDAGAVVETHTAGFGRLAAPLASPRFWHWYSAGAERAHNDFLAIYQYMRQNLRRRAGLKELPAYPHTEVSYRVTDAERAEVYKKAAAAGYRFMLRQNPESPVDKLPDTLPWCQEIVAAGMHDYSWSAGSYVQGRDGWVYKTHPEWFARDAKGEIQRYFGSPTDVGYPVIDINNEEFRKWYKETVQILIDKGDLRWIYRDMDGTASGTVNFGLPRSPDGMKSQIDVYQFFHNQDVRVGIEGMNPLVIDQFWYRANLYAPLAGKEFSLVGTAPWCDLEGGTSLDPFRLGMYGCFPRFEIEATFLGVERIPDEVKRGQRVVSLVKPFNEALDNTGMPFIRETPFGTSWIGEKGGALLFWNPAKKVVVDLPENWKIEGVEGNVLLDVKPDSIYLLKKSR
ncbi:MAG: hypothetical protein MJ016_02795 [Victivallaceae bacterium]|nr:hypothetical protein [Victivallaceae bacterium]